ncbi:DNA-binding response regulator [Paenibacillus qinlingensis]|uniref:DNA-binding response regulator n=1 Tax=Paenibacillus qinlingensis TaxID=1837343 RepID=UPI0015679302|nr:DNA-binding response regulator [Paenibacillus qinlingensis]NQX61018.1 DNA-binding response regulator [Paenibacillus qinlingensis]
MKIEFEVAHDGFIAYHSSTRKGDSLRRLLEGHSHAEKLFLLQVWWPAFKHFNDLHPEYEVKDFRDGTRFLDFAFIKHTLKLAIEIDGFTTHASQISRSQFSDHLIRQNHLIIDGWRILRFSYDDIKDRPRMCQQVLQQFMGRYLGMNDGLAKVISYVEKEVLRYAINLETPLTNQVVCGVLSIKEQKARQLLKIMHDKKLLESVGKGTQRIKYYRPTDEALQQLMG